MGKFLLPFLFLGLAVVTLVNLAGLHPAVGGLGLLVLLMAGLYGYALPMLLSWLKLEPNGLTGSINGRRFHIFWSEVLAAWMIKRGRHPFLCLGTHQGTAIIPLRFFNVQAVWSGIRQYASPTALESTAYQRLPHYREWAAVRDGLVTGNPPPCQTIDHWGVQIAGWGGLGFFISASIHAWNAGNREMLWLLAPLSALAVLVIANWGITEFDGEGIRRRTMTGSWQIRWDELKRVEIDPFETLLVFEGAQKRLVVSGPAVWVPSGRRDALTLLQAQCEYRQIPMRHSLLALLKSSSRTRVKSN